MNANNEPADPPRASEAPPISSEELAQSDEQKEERVPDKTSTLTGEPDERSGTLARNVPSASTIRQRPSVEGDLKSTAPKKAPQGAMIVETETVSAVPTVAVTPTPQLQYSNQHSEDEDGQGGGGGGGGPWGPSANSGGGVPQGAISSSGPSSGGAVPNLSAGDSTASLKIKKSVDNVTRNSTRSTTKKKKSSRLGPGGPSSSKAEIFAAKIASAVDEAAQSSDSDETFVYESNPEHSGRPRFQHRNLSSSSVSRAQNNHHQHSNSFGSRGPPASRDGNANPIIASNANPSVSSFNSNYNPAPTTSTTTTTTGAGPGSSSATAPPAAGIRRPTSPRRNLATTVHNPYPASPFLRPSASRQFDDAKYSTYGRFRTAYDSDDEDEDLEATGEADIEDDEDHHSGTNDYSETTPLRGSSGLPAYKSIRRARKNGGLSMYSPHNYQRKIPSARARCIRVLLWGSFFILCILMAGFVIGFLLASSKPLYQVKVDQIFDLVISEEELAFDMVVEAINPGLLSVQVCDADLDVFAKSPYVREDSDGYGDEGSQTMLLGNVKHFNAPATFEGSFFSHTVHKAVADVRLMNPGKNVTVDDDNEDNDDYSFDFNNAYDVSKDEHLDKGQKRWVRVSGHPFDLIVRGVLEYDLMIGRGRRTVSIAKTVHVDPDVVVPIDRVPANRPDQIVTPVGPGPLHPEAAHDNP
uniref:ARAD1D36300p n=1 Tax=Blastobotrys adeninivorans TaxID=409370 RepID=A0A060TH63_BLAAD